MITHHQHPSDERHRYRPATVRKAATTTTRVLRSGEQALASPALSRFVGREAEMVDCRPSAPATGWSLWPAPRGWARRA